MKKIEAIIKPFKLDEVKEALQKLVCRVSQSLKRKASVARKAIPSCIAVLSMWLISSPNVKVEVILTDEQVEGAVEAIQKAAQTGRIGDGKIFISTVEQAIRIRTGEDRQRSGLIRLSLPPGPHGQAITIPISPRA